MINRGGARMFCRQCGTVNDDNAFKCVACGAVLDRAPTAAHGQAMHTHGEHVPNYLVQAILVTLFCCLPFGIVAIVYAAQVNSRLQAGDTSGARHASGNARMWCWISFGLGLAFGLFYMVAVVLAGMNP
jgi:hypothetical protein